VKVILPSIEFPERSTEKAQRPITLAGRRVGFLDGWGEPQQDGSVEMYATMKAIDETLRQQYGTRDSLWLQKPSISEEVPIEILTDFAGRVDVVVNGEGL
jgi:hypothetical protein